jgi:hypothetical protein
VDKTKKGRLKKVKFEKAVVKDDQSESTSSAGMSIFHEMVRGLSDPTLLGLSRIVLEEVDQRSLSDKLDGI